MPQENKGGDWRVLRNCCATGNCSTCRGVTPYGKTVRVVHIDHVTEEYARRVATNWQSYGAEAEPMPIEVQRS